jgi:enoyl-CoA hydratase
MTVRHETDGPVAIITIDRPDVRNAVDRPTAEALADHVRRFEADDALGPSTATG